MGCGVIDMKIGAMVTVDPAANENAVKEHLNRLILDEIWKRTTVKYQYMPQPNGTIRILAKAEVNEK